MCPYLGLLCVSNVLSSSPYNKHIHLRESIISFSCHKSLPLFSRVIDLRRITYNSLCLCCGYVARHFKEKDDWKLISSHLKEFGESPN